MFNKTSGKSARSTKIISPSHKPQDSPADVRYGRGGFQKKQIADPMLLIASGIDYDPLPESVVTPGSVHVYAPGEKITVLTDQNIQDVADLGFSAVQFSAGDFYNRDLDLQGNADWRGLDGNLAILKRHGLKAILVAGYHWIPPCLQQHPKVTPLRCLQHRQEIPILSVWSPFTYEWIETCVRALARHLQEHHREIQAILASLYGDFGEAIFPAGMLNVLPGHETNATTQSLHNHGDFWCDDPCARADFVRFLQARERDSDPNVSWNPEQADLFPTPETASRHPRRWLDFLEWYHLGMTQYAQKVVGFFRHYFPNTELVIYLGGGIEPHQHGQDNTGLPKAMKSVQATIRSTASGACLLSRQVLGTPETLALSFQKNYPIVKRIASACHHYDVPLWLEPPYPPGLEGPSVIARIFEAVSCGAVGYFEWTRTLQRQKEIYRRYAPMLTYQQPIVDVAVYFPILSHRREVHSAMPEPFWNTAATLRQITDFDVVDDRMIRDGALGHYTILALPQVDLLEDDIFEKITQWVANGGILAAQDSGPIHCLDTRDEDKRRWFGLAGDSKLAWGHLINVFSTGTLIAEVSRRFGSKPVLSFDRLAPHGEPVLTTSAGAAVVRCHWGKGTAYFCTAVLQGPPLLLDVVSDLIQNDPQTALLSCRELSNWVRNHPQVFATMLGSNILLANLAAEPVTLKNQGHSVSLNAYDLTYTASTAGKK